MTQKAILFSGDIRSNVLFGESRGGSSDGDVREALDLAQASEFVEKLPQGIRAPIAQGGSNVSGGQKQRVGIARALMQDPALLLCDEPIASLDPSSSKIIMDQIRDMARTRNIGCIVNLHQVDVAKTYADRIVGIHQGRVVFDGPPQELTNAMIETIYDAPIEELTVGLEEAANG